MCYICNTLPEGIDRRSAQWLGEARDMHNPWTPRSISSLTKTELDDLIRDVQAGNNDAVDRAVQFIEYESFGVWHNRARSKLCRHFKNKPPPKADCDRLVSVIVQRLIQGRFHQQFKDQLKFAIRMAPGRMADAAGIAMNDDRDYVRRYGAWVHYVLNSTNSSS